MEGQGQCLTGQGEGHRVSRSLSDMCHHDLDILNTCHAFKSPETKGWFGYWFIEASTLKSPSSTIWETTTIRPKHKIFWSGNGYCLNQAFWNALMIELGSSQWGGISSPQTATDVVAKQSLGSWSLLWSLNSHSVCGSTSLWFPCRDLPDKGSVSCFGR